MATTSSASVLLSVAKDHLSSDAKMAEPALLSGGSRAMRVIFEKRNKIVAMEDGHVNFVFLGLLTSGSNIVSKTYWPLQGTDFDTFDFVSS